MNRQRVLIAVTAGVGMLCTFLPWVTIPIFGSISGARGDGWITFALFLVALLMALLSGDKERPLTGKLLPAVLAPAVLAAGIGIWKIIDFNQKMGSSLGQDDFSKFMGASVSIGFGLYLLVIAGIALVVVAVRFRD